MYTILFHEGSLIEFSWCIASFGLNDRIARDLASGALFYDTHSITDPFRKDILKNPR
jgi:hypothetical protein